MKPLAAVIFDFDGTLVRLRATGGQMQQLRDALADLFAEIGPTYAFRPFYQDVDRAWTALEHEREPVRRHMRRRTLEVIASYERQFSVDSERCAYARQAWDFASKRWPVGIVSSNSAACVRQALVDHGVWRCPDAFPLVAFEDVDRHEPHPDGLVEMARQLGLSSDDRFAYVGDHGGDLEACRLINELDRPHAVPICVAGGKCRWVDLTEHPYFPQAMAIPDLSQLPAAIPEETFEHAY